MRRLRASDFASRCLVLALAAVPAGAQDDAQKACLAQVPASAERQVEACTALLASNRYNERNRAIIHNNRGVAQRARGDLAAAIADYDEAIRLNRDYARAYVESRQCLLRARRA